MLEGEDDARAFAFHHNGFTLSAQALTRPDGTHRITTEASPELVKSVTVNSNRRNPAAPWNSRANDRIQPELQDELRDDLGIYDARQERAFENPSDEDLEERGITVSQAVELVRLARTFLVSDGEVERLAQSIVDVGANKYAHVQKTRNLLSAFRCQAIRNAPRLEGRAGESGGRLSLEKGYVDWLASLAATRYRLVLSGLVADKTYADKAAEGDFSLRRTRAAGKHGLALGYDRWRWVEKRRTR